MELKVNKNLQEAYSNQYNDESAIWRGIGAEKKVENILKIIDSQHFKSVLEVGAGDGSVLELLSKTNIADELHALEISESGIQQIKSKEIKNLKTVKLFDGYVLPFEDQSIDLLILTHVLEHVEHERILLREIHRVAKQFVIEVPKDYRFGADKKVAHFLSYGHINLYTPTSLKFLLLTENFKIIKEQTSLYHLKSFTFGKRNLSGMVISYLSFLVKSLLANFPIKYVREKFINTITILAKPENKEIKIF
ncbi:MAG: class I SAM-dependent methyltransferase [Bacteroidota bacterium]